MENKTLSDKIKEDESGHVYVYTEDVREFIRELKIEISQTKDWTDDIERIWQKIDKLAGGELK